MLGITKIILKKKITKKKKIETTDLQERNGTKDLYQKCKVRNGRLYAELHKRGYGHGLKTLLKMKIPDKQSKNLS